ncbi:MAG TPA: excinuclease ABC subunit UvrC [Steroidobacteraceae bacterium]|nr:excinuclease ABC subunit UvrC [Steroidobacteraceae bacterium]
MATFDPKEFVGSLPRRPGVYRMYGANHDLLYVGKARNLRDRVGTYFNPSNVVPKVHALVQQITAIEVTVTHSEVEALLLEYNLIKEHRPRFNVVLRDDKSFPYIHLRTDHEFPKLAFYRGARAQPGRYFGPFPNAGAVRETLQGLQKLFRIRNCRDSFFANRTRPCLQHQIGRCSAPCVGLIDAVTYGQDVEAAVKVLEGRNQEVHAQLRERMEVAAQRLQFERAAQIRDQLAALANIQSQQIVTSEESGDADAFAVVGEPGEYAISVMLVRGGRNLGTTSYFPRAALADPDEALGSFILQYYTGQEPPSEVLLSLALADSEAMGEVLRERAKHAVSVRRPVRGIAARWVELTQENATQALRMRQAQRRNAAEMMVALADALDLAQVPQRIECFDISHTAGEGTVASCVVFGPEGAMKKEYRRFNIAGITPGDDYAALHQALLRRYARVKEGEIQCPDLLLIDGGAGQIAAVHSVLMELGVTELTLVGIAKGPDRRPGQERLFVQGEDVPLTLPPESAALRLVQRVRDEAHRFAITGHRKRRARRFNESVLESIAGLGPARRRALLRHFGGLQGVLRAAVADIEQVEGIGASLARNIYDHLHPGA